MMMTMVMNLMTATTTMMLLLPSLLPSSPPFMLPVLVPVPVVLLLLPLVVAPSAATNPKTLQTTKSITTLEDGRWHAQSPLQTGFEAACQTRFAAFLPGNS